MQRFISEDPIEFSGGDTNLYAYVGGNPVNSRDPTGEVAPLALALPFAIPATIATLSKVGLAVGYAAAAVYTVYQATRVDDPNRTLTPEEAVEKKRENAEYHKRCDASPPGGLDKCAEAKWLLQQAIDCLQMRLAWSQKWGVHHDDQIEQRQASIERLKRRVKQDCKCKS